MFLVKFNAWPYCATTDTVIIALRHVSSMNVELQHTPPLSAQSIREERRWMASYLPVSYEKTTYSMLYQ